MIPGAVPSSEEDNDDVYYAAWTKDSVSEDILVDEWLT